jgi:hypothetical protein
MDELVFTNPEGPKVTPHQERSGPPRWTASLRSGHSYWKGITAETELFISGGRFRSERRCDLASGNILKNSLRVFMGRFADQDGWP